MSAWNSPVRVPASVRVVQSLRQRPRPALPRAAGFVLLAALVLGTGAARAQEDRERAPLEGAPVPERIGLSLTVYNNNLGLVRDVRAIEVPGGQGWVQFREVPARIDPTSVHLQAVDGQPLAVVEQNFRYDLVSTDRILERYLDYPIQVVLEDGRLYEGRLLSADPQTLVLGNASPDGAVTVLSREKVNDIRFPELPEGLITRPTLAWLLDAPRAAEREVEVSYLTDGLDWHAEYVAVVDPDETGINLSAWVSLGNQSGATYREADLQLVAGAVRRVTPQPMPMAKGAAMERMDLAQAPGFTEESFFEYHLYTLGRPTTLADKETKQVALFEPADARVAKRYESNPQRDAQKVRIVLETENSAANGLGMPLPEGIVRVFKRDPRGRMQFIGEDRINHTPRDEKLRVFIGYAFDIVAERTQLELRRLSERAYETDIQIEVRNRKDEPVTVIVQEDLYGFWEIVQTSVPYEKKSATQIEYTVPVPANATETVTYTVRFTQ